MHEAFFSTPLFYYIYILRITDTTLANWRERERNVLFNDALITFYLRLYGVRHMVKDHSDSEKGNPLPPHRLLLSINRQDNTYHGLCYTSRGALAGMRNSSMGPPHEGSIRWPTAWWANALPLSYVPLLQTEGAACQLRGKCQPCWCSSVCCAPSWAHHAGCNPLNYKSGLNLTAIYSKRPSITIQLDRENKSKLSTHLYQ